MGLDNPDLINRTVVRGDGDEGTRDEKSRRCGVEGETTTTGSPPPFRNVRVTNAFKNKMDDPRAPARPRDFLCIYIFTLYQSRRFKE